MGHRSIRLPDGLEARIVAVAAAEDRSFSRVVVRALEQALGPVERPQSSQGASPAPARASEPADEGTPLPPKVPARSTAEGIPKIARRHWA